MVVRWLLLLTAACARPTPSAAPIVRVEPDPIVIATVHGTGIDPVPSELCAHAFLPGSMGMIEGAPLDRDRAGELAQWFVAVMSRSTGVFLPPQDPAGEWALGVLAEEPIASREVSGGWEFAFPFRCPLRRDVARVVRIGAEGRRTMLYPPVRMPGWELLPILPPRTYENIDHPELVGVWEAGVDDRGVRCGISGFSYDGRSIVMRIDTMREWEFRTEDSLRRFPARWHGRTLQVEMGRAWYDHARIDDRGILMDAHIGCSYVPWDHHDDPPQFHDACRRSEFSRPRPPIPDALPRNAGPMMMRCDDAGHCGSNQYSLEGFLCALHGIEP